jgi:hypothetical protein
MRQQHSIFGDFFVGGLGQKYYVLVILTVRLPLGCCFVRICCVGSLGSFSPTAAILVPPCNLTAIGHRMIRGGGGGIFSSGA